jgi:hypothetical protein
MAMMRMPDGHGRIELSRFLAPPVVADHRNAPVNALGYLRVMFAVDDLDDTLARLSRHGAQLVDEVARTKTCIASATSRSRPNREPRTHGSPSSRVTTTSLSRQLQQGSGAADQSSEVSVRS